ncbi:MAG: hypothetical protein DHS20C13_26210 [Thermodesulfobacteriota bacterium]|nr:MAG: hypothetical protein DHS20C13_26210 [Thermodesulfobacteriota bacterium]
MECIADFAKDVYGDDLVYCCAHGTTFDGFECRDIEEFYDNCSYSASDYVRKDNGPNGALTFPENLCAKC